MVYCYLVAPFLGVADHNYLATIMFDSQAACDVSAMDKLFFKSIVNVR